MRIPFNIQLSVERSLLTSIHAQIQRVHFLLCCTLNRSWSYPIAVTGNIIDVMENEHSFLERGTVLLKQGLHGFEGEMTDPPGQLDDVWVDVLFHKECPELFTCTRKCCPNRSALFAGLSCQQNFLLFPRVVENCCFVEFLPHGVGEPEMFSEYTTTRHFDKAMFRDITKSMSVSVVCFPEAKCFVYVQCWS